MPKGAPPGILATDRITCLSEFVNEKIIVIDDERMILDLTAMVLQHRGYRVFTADNALDGYEIIDREQPAVALLDYMMPQINGLTALREIRLRFPET